MSLFNLFARPVARNAMRLSSVRQLSSKTPPASTKTAAQPVEDELQIPRNLLEPFQSSHQQTENGAIVDKKPFKLHLEAGKSYSWCLCGKSKSQPICDGLHKNVHYKIKLRPVRFQVEKTGYYWLCNCKHTKNRPFCDGTHKEAHIQAAIK